MERKSKKWGFVIVGAVAAVALGAIAVAERRDDAVGVAEPIGVRSAGGRRGRPGARAGLRRRRSAGRP